MVSDAEFYRRGLMDALSSGNEKAAAIYRKKLRDLLNKSSLFIFFVFLMSFSSSAIIDYNVASPVPIGYNLTAIGRVSIVPADGICSFSIVDDKNNIVWIPSDEKVSSQGLFRTNYLKLEEPLFKRGFDYNLHVYCGSDFASKKFSIIQRESIAYAIKQEFNFITQRGNFDAVLIVGGAIVFFGAMALLLWMFVKKGADYARGR